MEILSLFWGDKHEFSFVVIKFKHEFCLVVIRLKHVRSGQSFDITYT